MKRKFVMLILALVLMMTLTVPALALEGKHVNDRAGILNEQEALLLDAYAREVSQKWDCGVYVLIVDDYADYGAHPYEAAYTVYHEESLGAGMGRDGVILLLSMWQRDYAFFIYGANAEYALNDYAQLELEEAMLDDLAENRWYDGLEDFIGYCDSALEKADAGEPVQKSKAPIYIGVWVVAAVIAAIVCLMFYSQMKTARVKTQAHDFITPEGLRLTRTGDVFTHRTVRRRKIQTSSSGSSRSHSGGGGRGRSGKF